MVKRTMGGRFAAIIVGVLWLAAAQQAAAGEVPGARGGHPRTSSVTIEKKTSGGVLTKELRLVRVFPDTRYFDQNGRRIDFDSFAAPCKAVIVYEPVSKGDPEAVSVTVQQLLPGATRYVPNVPE